MGCLIFDCSVESSVIRRWVGVALLVCLSGLFPHLLYGQTLPARKVVVHRSSDKPMGVIAVGSRPSLVIGGTNVDAAYEFSMIAGIVPLSKGRWAVGNLSTSEIRIFDSAGKHIRSMGRKGRGPGEFPFLWNVWNIADTLVGVDGAGLGQVFSAEGKYLRSLPRPSANWRPVERFGYLADGSYVGGYVEPLDSDISVRRSLRHMVLVRGASDSTIGLGRYPANEIVRRKGNEPLPLVYGGRIVVAVLSDHYCVGYSKTYEFDCLAANGKQGVTVRLENWKAKPVTPTDRQRYFDGIDQGNPGPRGEKYRAEVREVTAFAESFPAYGRFVGSAAGEVWVGPLVPADATVGTFNPVPDGPTTWSVFDMQGAWVADVVLPVRFRLMQAGLHFVAGIQRDTNDVERVAVYPLTRR